MSDKAPHSSAMSTSGSPSKSQFPASPSVGIRKHGNSMLASSSKDGAGGAAAEALTPPPGPIAVAAGTPGSERLWGEVLEHVKTCVVALKVTYLRSISGEHPMTTRATGFLVADDLILTNRHVTGCGPIHATALFDQNEEVEVSLSYGVIRISTKMISDG